MNFDTRDPAFGHVSEVPWMVMSQTKPFWQVIPSVKRKLPCTYTFITMSSQALAGYWKICPLCRIICYHRLPSVIIMNIPLSDMNSRAWSGRAWKNETDLFVIRVIRLMTICTPFVATAQLTSHLMAPIWDHWQQIRFNTSHRNTFIIEDKE